MDEQNRNLILATALSFLVILVWFILFPPEEVEQAALDASTTAVEGAIDPNLPNVGAEVASAETAAPAAQEVIEAPRVPIQTSELTGSISLQGARIDDLSLLEYNETIEDGAPIVRLLKPEGEAGAYMSIFGWTGEAGTVPDDNTVWTLSEGDTLTPDTPVTLTWDNGIGQVFSTTISIDEEFMVTYAQSIANNGSAAFTSRPYGLLRRHGEPADLKNFFILHEGLVRMADGELAEVNYDDVVDYGVNGEEGTIEVTESGWIGWTDHYWMTTLIPDQSMPFRASARYFESRNIYQAEAIMPSQTIAPGDEITVATRLFAGAKEWEPIRNYERDGGVSGFLDSIDWGWFFMLTKPMFWLLHELNKIIGNMGWAIIGLTVVIKLLVLPLAYKSYVSMAKMKELQPQMEKLKEEAGEDRTKMQQGMMKLYKDNKVNPAAGCLPILIQIPIFFSLYKVIFVTIELRHAPWIGWIKDLSAPDTSSIFNLFGILPWGAPEPGSILALIFIGILPLCLGVSMWLQQKLNPSPTDATQKMIFAWMPWVFMFMLGSFASGLVVYWIANNVITFTQQYLIMRSQGAKPDVFGNIRESFKRATVSDEKKDK